MLVYVGLDETVVELSHRSVHLLTQRWLLGCTGVGAYLIETTSVRQDAGDALLIQEPPQGDLYRWNMLGAEPAAQAGELMGGLHPHLVGDHGVDPAGVEGRH